MSRTYAHKCYVIALHKELHCEISFIEERGHSLNYLSQLALDTSPQNRVCKLTTLGALTNCTQRYGIRCDTREK